MKQTVYLDATIPSYMFDERESIKTYVEITRRWQEEESVHFDIWTSEETIAELSVGDYPNKEQILAFVAEQQVLSPSKEILEIAQIYLDNYVMPQILKGDAIHLSYASFYKIDFLLTWNCNHLANANKKQHIRIVNARLNLFTPEITTPMELFKEETYGN